jgi:nucleoside phosphorylase
MPIKLSFNSYTIGWLCALPKSELVAAEAMLDEAHEPPGNLGSHDDNCYTYGSINQHNVVIVHMPGGMPGTLSAQRMAQPLSKTFPNLKIHLLVGIAGGVPRDPPLEDPNKDIHLGDVVVGWADVTGDPAIVQWDFMREENDGECRLLGRLANPHVRLLNALGVLQKKSVQGKTRFSDHLERVEVEGFSYPGLEYDRLYRADYPHPNQDSFDCSSCDPNEMVKREPRTARTLIWHQGTIASGNQVVRNPMTRDKVSKRCYNALAFEMEAAGVMNEKHCLVIRGIADYCDTHKNWLWQNWAATTAAAFARELLYTIQPQAVDEIEPLATTARGKNPFL